jgi:ectoine hydroxylase-related dioxygenase (phytanoyl-CoA dioxygenase family)
MSLATHAEQFRAQGYTVARGLFSPQEAAALRTHLDRVRHDGPREDGDAGFDTASTDPLLQWPRLLQVHRWDAASRDWLLDPRVTGRAASLLETTPLAVQCMVYFKPPGSRGQALHQDQYFIRARPGTCLAAWMALDDTDDENGCIRVVPGSQDWPLLCPEPADTRVSFARDSIPLPPGTPELPIEMRAGDVLFFNGSLVHGSRPNRSDTRFRRALIGHFIESRATSVVAWNQPVIAPDGQELWLEESAEGGPCGVWVDRDGEQAIAVTSALPGADFLAPH